MTLPKNLQPGDFGLTPTYGVWYDKAVGWTIRYGTDSPVNHAFVYVGGGQIVEARPTGAGYASVDKYDADGVTWSSGAVGLASAQRDAICAHANKFVADKVGYNWSDIAAIALAQHRAGSLIHADRIKQPWWVRELAETDRLMCSQLVDYAYFLSGVHLFNDGRLFGLVSPGDLYTLVKTR